MIGFIITVYIIVGVLSMFTNIAKSGIFAYIVAIPLFPFWLLNKYIHAEEKEKKEISSTILGIVALLLILYFFIIFIKFLF